MQSTIYSVSLCCTLSLSAVPLQAAEPLQPVEQQALNFLLASGERHAAFEAAFEAGDELFETSFSAAQGVGARVDGQQRFSRVPRADLSGPGDWANHQPRRATGPNAQACNACHNMPVDDGAGGIAANAVRDPLHSGNPALFIQRNTPHLFGLGAIQLLAEEMTAELQGQWQRAREQTCREGEQRLRLQTKGVSFGRLRLTRRPGEPCTVDTDTRQLRGVDDDLVVRALQWKGSRAFLRDFNRDAAHNELGMQGAELVGVGVDGDFDGVTDEFSVGDLTALTVYVAAQPRPTTRLELHELGLIEALDDDEIHAIRRGEERFAEVGCGACHRPELRLEESRFREPSALLAFRDAVFPAGGDPQVMGLDPGQPLVFDLVGELPDNQVFGADGEVFDLGGLNRDRQGGVRVALYGDLRRHDMGPELAEPIDETGVGASVWLTPELWGVGSTAPYLHDGRATTLEEAILAHGGEGSEAREAFAALGDNAQTELLAFLQNLVLFKLP